MGHDRDDDLRGDGHSGLARRLVGQSPGNGSGVYLARVRWWLDPGDLALDAITQNDVGPARSRRHFETAKIVSTTAKLWDGLGRLSLPARAALLGVWLIVVWAAIAPISLRMHEEMGFLAATLAAGICLVSAELALLIWEFLRAPALALYGVLVGMLVRMGLPLIIGGALHLANKPLADAGLLYYVLVFYLATLIVETVLILAQLQNNARVTGSH